MPERPDFMKCYPCQHQSNQSALIIAETKARALRVDDISHMQTQKQSERMNCYKRNTRAAKVQDILHRQTQKQSFVHFDCFGTCFFCNRLAIILQQRPERNIHLRNPNARGDTNKPKPEQSQCTKHYPITSPEQPQCMNA